MTTYNRTVWATGDVITATKLNNAESGIETAHSELANHDALTASMHGATSAATASRLVLRDGFGRAKVSAPAAADDIARLDTMTQWGLGSIAKLVSTQSWNDQVVTGFYRGDAMTDRPPALTGRHTWDYGWVIAHDAAGIYVMQFVNDYNNKGLFVREAHSVGGVRTWGPWHKILGDNNLGAGAGSGTLAEIQALIMPTDTRSWTATTWNAANKPTHIDLKSGATVVATIDAAYNAANKPTQIVVAGGGKTITYTITWTDLVKLTSIAKAVV